MARTGDVPPLNGTWSGTIGTYPVRMCIEFQRNGVRGGYYYLNHRVPIALHGTGADLLTEGGLRADGPQWHIGPQQNGQIHGHWRDAAKELPINMHREHTTAGDDLDLPCASHVYFGPLVNQIRWQDKPAHFGQAAYIRRDIVPPPGLAKALTISVVQLDGTRPGDAQINTALRYGQQPWGPEGWVGCFGMSLGFLSEIGDYAHREEPVLLASSILSQRVSDENYCGGAHPNASYSYANYDRLTGRAFDVSAWFREGVIAPRTGDRSNPHGSKQILPNAPLFKVIMAHFPADNAECRDDIVNQRGMTWWVGLSPAGFLFAPEEPHVEQACEAEIVVPLAAVAGFLTPQAFARLSATFR